MRRSRSLMLALGVVLASPGSAAYDRSITLFSPDGQLMQVSYAEQAVNKGALAVAVTNGRDTIALCVESPSNTDDEDEMPCSDGNLDKEVWCQILIPSTPYDKRKALASTPPRKGVWGLPVARRDGGGLKAGGVRGGGVVDDSNNQDRKLCKLDEGVYLAFAGLSADGRVLSSKIRVECQSYRYSMGAAPTIGHIAKYVGGLQHRYTRTGGARPYGVSCLIVGFDEDNTPRVFRSEPSGMFAEWTASTIGRGSDKVV
ncbi:unnamed protein product, partial [Discosporangium mesarthrocarpum]